MLIIGYKTALPTLTKLRRAVPLLWGPFNVVEQRVVDVVERHGGRRPRTNVAGGVGVAASKRVRAGEGDDFLVCMRGVFIIYYQLYLTGCENILITASRAKRLLTIEAHAVEGVS